MPYLAFLPVVVVLVAIIWELTGRSKNPVVRRLKEIERSRWAAQGASEPGGRWRGIGALLQRVGTGIRGKEERSQGVARLLSLAGFRSPGAVAIYHASRFLLAFPLFALPFLVTVFVGLEPAYGALAGVYFALIGLFAPRYWLKLRITARQKELRKALADTLDLLVVCVEAGLGLNQALIRVATDVAEFSRAMSEELRIVNLEIRAGTPRETALRNLGERTEVDDIRSLAAMLIQADRFGTSVGQALRVHSDSLRIKRRQRAEEAAAKTTIKLVFPLVLFVFPALFVVILGPVLLRILDQMSGLG